MDAADGLIDSLREAVAARPQDVVLRVHLAELLLSSGHAADAVAEAAHALRQDPDSARARQVMVRALAAAGTPTAVPLAEGTEATADPPTSAAPDVPAPRPPAHPGPGAVAGDDGFDWGTAEDEVSDVIGPRFVEPARVEEPGQPSDVGAYDTERPTVRLADVGGMQAVKERLEAAFLTPMRNPELRKVFAKSLRGGLLLYGPPGCGKTFIARALAGELDASFVSVGITDVLDMFIGNSEAHLHEIFSTARRKAPCVLFFDELDALGQKRSQTRHSAIRGTVNQLLTELDSVAGDNEGVFVLGATNQPWDIDPALRRPGRFDRTVLVLPPDAPARAAIIQYQLRERPIENIDLSKLVAATGGFSGADITYLCETAAERALIESSRTGTVRMIDMADFEAALAEVRPSAGPWFDSARNVVMFANEGGMYDDLAEYLKHSR